MKRANQIVAQLKNWTNRKGGYTCNPFYVYSITVIPSQSTLVRSPSEATVYTSDSLNLTCTTSINPAVNTEVRVTHRWVGPNGVLASGSSMSISEVTGSGQDYTSTVQFNSLRSSDSGSYSCFAVVYSEPSSISIATSEGVSLTTTFKAGI